MRNFVANNIAVNILKPIQVNIKHLRTLRKLSQERFADELKWTRSVVGSYEEGRSEPPIERLIDLSNYFDIPIDILVRKDLRRAKDTSFIEVGNKRVLFPITVNEENEDFTMKKCTYVVFCLTYKKILGIYISEINNRINNILT